MYQRQQGNYAEDDDTKILLQKAWCHGQSIAPPLLGGLVVFVRPSNSTTSGHSASWIESIIILTIVMSWPVLSWRSMQHPSPRSLRRIVGGGAVMLGLYVHILLRTMLPSHPKDDEGANGEGGGGGGGVRILLLVFTSLMMVETMAYLAVVGYHRAWFEQASCRGTEGEVLHVQ